MTATVWTYTVLAKSVRGRIGALDLDSLPDHELGLFFTDADAQKHAAALRETNWWRKVWVKPEQRPVSEMHPAHRDVVSNPPAGAEGPKLTASDLLEATGFGRGSLIR